MNKIWNLKILFINLVLILFGAYTVEFLSTIKSYILTSNNRDNFDFKISKLQQDSIEASTHPFSVRKFKGSGSIIQYFSKKGIEVVERFSPTAPYIIENDGIKIGDNKLFPFTAQGNKLTILCGESGFWVFYKSDNYGFRNLNKNWDLKKPDVAFVGDSFTHGACVEQKDTFSGIAESNGLKTINLGIGGTGPLTQLGVYKEYISQNNVSPKILAWVFFAEDVEDILQENKSLTLNRYLNDSSFTQHLAAKREIKDELFERFYQRYKKHPDEIIYKSRRPILPRIKKKLNQIIVLFNLRKSLSNIFNFESPHYKKKETIDLIKKSIYRFKEEAEKTDSKIVFVYIPTWHEYNPSNIDDLKRNTRNDNYLLRNDIFKLLSRNNIEIIDTRKLIGLNGSEEARDYYNFSLYGHFTPNGYRKVGNYISEELRKLRKEINE